MKLFNLKKQSVLKAILLLMLAANFSWDPIVERLNSSDLASKGRVTKVVDKEAKAEETAKEEKSDADKAAEKAAEEAARKAEEAAAQKAAEAEKSATQASKPTAPAQSEQREPITIDEKICNVAGKVIYQKVDDTKTEVTLQTCPECAITITRDGSLDKVVNQRGDVNAALAEILKKQVGDKCDPEKLAKKEDDEKKKKELTEEEKKKQAEDIKNCVIDRRTKEEIVGDSERLRCQIDRLSTLDSEDYPKGEKRKRMMAEVESIRGKIKTSLKSMLLSKDDSRREEGEELADEAIAALESVSTENDFDDRKIQKFVNEIEAWKVGGEVAGRTYEREDDVSELRDRFKEAVTDYREAQRECRKERGLGADFGMSQMCGRWLEDNFRRQLDSLRAEHQGLTGEIYQDIHGQYDQLIRMTNYGYITGTDLREFSDPYRLLRQQMIDMVSPGKLGLTGLGLSTMDGGLYGSSAALLNAPTDIASIRGRAMTSRGGSWHPPLRAPTPNTSFGNQAMASSIFPDTQFGRFQGAQPSFGPRVNTMAPMNGPRPMPPMGGRPMPSMGGPRSNTMAPVGRGGRY